MNQAELIEVLTDRGCPVEPRTLGSWRAKGLMLPLDDQGRGRARGKDYLVPDPITELDRAVTVYRLLGRHSRTATALISVFFAGFPVEAELLRKAWLSRIDKITEQLCGLQERFGSDLEGVINKWAVAIARKTAPTRPDVHVVDLIGVIQEIYSLIFNPNFDFDAESNFFLFAPFMARTITPLGSPLVEVDFFDERSLAAMAQLFKSAFSITSIRKLVATATADEFATAQRHWKMAGDILKRFTPPLGLSGEFTNHLTIERQFAIAFGGFAVVPLLYLARFDPDQTMERALALIDKFSRRPPIQELLATQGANIPLADGPDPEFMTVWAGLKKIWSEFQFELIREEIIDFQTQSGSDANARKLARQLISQKLQNCLRTLREVAPKSAARDKAIEYTERQIGRLQQGRSLSVDRLLGVEGGSAALYFQAFHGMPIKWQGTGRRPIPCDWHRLGARVSPFTNSGWRARHPVNAMLNYAYAVLYGQVRTKIIADGLDPNIGLLHSHATKKRDNLTLDLMEPMRPLVDRMIFELTRDEAFSSGDFTIVVEGVCRLSPQLGRLIAAGVSHLLQANG